MAYDPNDPYGLQELFGGDFSEDPSFFTSEIVKRRQHAVENLTNVFGGNPYDDQESQKGEWFPGNPSPPAPTPPNPWLTTSTYTAPTGVKQATPDIVVFDNTTIDIEYLTQNFFEEFGGHELIKISRSDLIDGKQVSYNPIKNLSRLNQKYNPNNVISIAPFQQNLSLYAIDLILRGIHEPYVDRENGYLVIEIDNVKSNESIEVEIAVGGTMNRVIYDY